MAIYSDRSEDPKLCIHPFCNVLHNIIWTILAIPTIEPTDSMIIYQYILQCQHHCNSEEMHPVHCQDLSSLVDPSCKQSGDIGSCQNTLQHLSTALGINCQLRNDKSTHTEQLVAQSELYYHKEESRSSIIL